MRLTHDPYAEQPHPDTSLWTQRVSVSLILWVIIYILATSFTRAAFFGDTRAYTSSILDFTRGETYHFWEDNAFWEFGHLLWRPAGWLAFRISQPVTSRFVGSEPRANIAISLFALNWIAGLLSVVVLNVILRKLGTRPGPANLVTLAFLFSQAFLNFAQTGLAYIPGLLLLLLSLNVLITGSSGPFSIWLTTLTAGIAFAGAVCLWFLYVLATPAVAVAPFVFSSPATKNRMRLGLQTCIVAGLLTICTYASVLSHLHLYHWRDLHTWIAASSHGVDNIRGLSRMMFGFARSFINMGADGVLYKRFLLHDPYNPVSFAQLFRLSLGKFLLFYSFLICVLVVLLRSQNRNLLVGLELSAIPVMGFALFWQGGDMERYLPLYPPLFITLSIAVGGNRPPRWFKSFVLIFVTFVVVNNSFALSKLHLDHRRQLEVNRIAPLQPMLTPGSQVVVLDQELANLGSDPLHSSVQEEYLPSYTLFVPGTSGVLTWRQDLATMALSVWEKGGNILISHSVLDSRPAVNLHWAEGDDRRISWHDVHGFFSQLEIGESIGGPDGFELIPASSNNRTFLQAVVRDKSKHPVVNP